MPVEGVADLGGRGSRVRGGMGQPRLHCTTNNGLVSKKECLEPRIVQVDRIRQRLPFSKSLGQPFPLH